VQQEPALFADSVAYNVAYGCAGPIKMPAGLGAQPRETGDTVKSLKAQTKLVQRWLRASIGRVLQQDGVPVETLEAETDRLVALLLGS
jgi:hypothetical protein